MNLALDAVASPIGTILVATTERALCALDFEDYRERMVRLLERRFGDVVLEHADDPLGAASAVRAYFSGDFAAFDTLELDGGGTPFQARVWALLRTIAPGTTASYGRLATLLESPQAARAVGAANALNPIAIAVPCHRVIGANAALTGYAGGLARKRWLLAHEQRMLPLPALA